MTVSQGSWHARVYRWWYERKFGHPMYSSNTNLCPYMRAVLFWSWMRYLFIDGRIGRFRVPIAAYIFLAVEVPRWVGMFSYEFKVALYIVYAAFAGTGCLVALVYFTSQWIKQSAWEPLKFKAVREFAGLVKAYSEAAHTRICPELELVKEDK